MSQTIWEKSRFLQRDDDMLVTRERDGPHLKAPRREVKKIESLYTGDSSNAPTVNILPKRYTLSPLIIAHC